MIFSAVIIVLGNRRTECERMWGLEGTKAASSAPLGLIPKGNEAKSSDMTGPVPAASSFCTDVSKEYFSRCASPSHHCAVKWGALLLIEYIISLLPNIRVKVIYNLCVKVCNIKFHLGEWNASKGQTINEMGSSTPRSHQKRLQTREG